MPGTDLPLDPDRTAVLALHWQVNVVRPEGFFGPLLAGPVASSGVVDRARELHTRARAAGVPVVFTRFTVPDDEGALVRNTGFMRAVADAQEAFRPDAPGAAVVDDVGYDSGVDEVLDNQRLSAFGGSDLAARFADRGVDTLLVTGVATNLTVEQSARQATDLGFSVHVVRDCVAAVDAVVHAASCANLDLTTEGCLEAAEVLARLEGR